MKNKIHVAFVCFLSFLTAIPQSPHAQTSGTEGFSTQLTDKWPLWTGPTQLRGANIHQRRVYVELDGYYFMGPGPLGVPYVQEDFDRLAAWGANYVNISHTGLFSESPPYSLDSLVQDNLDSLLAMIARANMYAVISFRTGPGRSEFTFLWEEVGDWFGESYLNDSLWQDQAAQDGWVAMWRYTAERYRNNPIVVGYDLMVEPNANEVGSHAINNLLDIWDPEEFYSEYGGTLYDWNQLYPRITTAIREVDSDTPLLIGGMGYSAVEWLAYMQTTADLRTVYAVHQYEPYVYTHQYPPLTKAYPGSFDTDWDGINDQFNKTWLDNLLSSIDVFKATHTVPVAVNEFGLMRWEPGGADFMEDQMDLFEERGMNYALWLWESSWEAHAEEDDFNFRHGSDPENHTEVDSSDLIDVIVQYWGRNTTRPTPVVEMSQDIHPKDIVLGQNYPNPFNSTTTIEFFLPRSGFITLKIFSILGKNATTVMAETLPAGHHTTEWNGDRFASGVYCYQLSVKTPDVTSKPTVEMKKLLLLK